MREVDRTNRNSSRRGIIRSINNSYCKYREYMTSRDYRSLFIFYCLVVIAICDKTSNISWSNSQHNCKDIIVALGASFATNCLGYCWDEDVSEAIKLARLSAWCRRRCKSDSRFLSRRLPTWSRSASELTRRPQSSARLCSRSAILGSALLPVIRVWSMGWSWSLHIAQGIMKEAIHRALGRRACPLGGGPAKSTPRMANTCVRGTTPSSEAPANRAVNSTLQWATRTCPVHKVPSRKHATGPLSIQITRTGGGSKPYHLAPPCPAAWPPHSRRRGAPTAPRVVQHRNLSPALRRGLPPPCGAAPRYALQDSAPRRWRCDNVGTNQPTPEV